eukprot:1257751-Alexandrium_andersonii.AAC.1
MRTAKHPTCACNCAAASLKESAPSARCPTHSETVALPGTPAASNAALMRSREAGVSSEKIAFDTRPGRSGWTSTGCANTATATNFKKHMRWQP